MVGELGASTSPRLLDAAATLDGHGDLTIDLDSLAFIGAASLNAVVEIRNAQQQQQGALSLVGMSPRTIRIFRDGGLAVLVA